MAEETEVDELIVIEDVCFRSLDGGLAAVRLELREAGSFARALPLFCAENAVDDDRSRSPGGHDLGGREEHEHREEIHLSSDGRRVAKLR